MNISVSKVFARFINKTAKELGFEAHAEVVEMSPHQYEVCVGDLGDADYYRDWADGLYYKAIVVVYPGDYYACPRYLSTMELTKEFRRRGVSNIQELKEMLRDMLEI